ncbi:MAG: RimK family alpha-L-glutamate ligase [Hyphomonadaceae bacterium]|nr:RimK family alpha-L-glutamate ligase [Hyphomonadaceae bacterium]
MRGWLLFHNPLDGDAPEAWEIHRFLEAGRKRGLDLTVVHPRSFELIVTTEREWRAEYDGKTLGRPDFIIPRTGAETNYFTLAVLRHFEQLSVAMVNGPVAVEACADKLQTLQRLSASGLPIPKTILAKFPVDVDLIECELGFPVVVKTLRSTRGAGVLLCQDRSQFDDLASLLGDANPGSDFIFQQYVATSHGRDVRLLVVDGKVAASMERRATNGGFKSNISLGGVGECMDAPPAMKELAVNAARSLGLDVAGIDMLFDEGGGYRICEANSSPGFVGLEKACGISVPDMVFDSVERRLRPPAPPNQKKTPFWKKILGGRRTTKPPAPRVDTLMPAQVRSTMREPANPPVRVKRQPVPEQVS